MHLQIGVGTRRASRPDTWREERSETSKEILNKMNERFRAVQVSEFKIHGVFVDLVACTYADIKRQE